MVDQPNALVRELSTPRAAALAGIIFAVLLIVALVALHVALPGDGSAVKWLQRASNRQSVSLTLSLIPFAGIAFLWFIGVIRSRLGDREDRLFATAFLGSGLVFVAMLFTAAAAVGALLHLYDNGAVVAPGDVRLASSLAGILLGTFGVRMAAVFTLVVTNLGRRTGIVPSWLVVLGFLTAAILLVTPPGTVWSMLLFPVWVFLLSVDILVKSLRGEPSLPSRQP
jgi:hypothetical protein